MKYTCSFNSIFTIINHLFVLDTFRKQFNKEHVDEVLRELKHMGVLFYLGGTQWNEIILAY